MIIGSRVVKETAASRTARRHGGWLGLLSLLYCCCTPASAANNYSEKAEFPNAPFSDWASPVKEMPGGGGFAASIAGSAQQRFQSLDNRRDFSFDMNDEDFSQLARERLSLDVHHGQTLRAFFEIQDAHEFWRDRLPPPNPSENSLDIYQAFVELGLLYDVVDKPSLVFRVGRQTLVYGHEHFFGDNDWLNTGTLPFDLAKVIWRPDGFQIDAFAGWPVTFNHRNPDTPSSHVNIAGANLKALGVPLGHNIEGLFVYKWNEKNDLIGERGEKGPERLLAFSALADGRFRKNWDYSLEASFETGERGEDNINAWRAIASLGYTHSFFNWRTVRLSYGYSLSSGDTDPNDGKAQGFDPLFARQFGHHGKILLTGGRNLEDFHTRVEAKLWRGGLIEIDHFLQRLDERRDAFYQSNGRPVRRDPAGRAGKDIGQEFDIQVTHTFNDNLLITGGAFIYDPGRLFKKTGNREDDVTRNIFFMVRVGF